MTYTGDADFIIYEGKLATEFGVSRTPIRQVIQSLAAEALVEVRSGVGTVATPLLQQYRVKDMQSFSSILSACSDRTVEDVSSLFLSELSALRLYLAQAQNDVPSDVFFEVANKLVAILEGLVEDNILRDALVACYWRYLRRRVAEHDGAFEPCIVELDRLIQTAESGVKEGSPEQVLRMISSAVLTIIETSQ
jgi:DNA-binding GntR family transcriptional regulator